MPRVNASGRGDLFVHLDVHIPPKLTRDQLPAENEPREKGIFDKVRDYFLEAAAPVKFWLNPKARSIRA